jgi:hypothetical protein
VQQYSAHARTDLNVAIGADACRCS